MRLSKISRIAKWEVFSGTSGLDKRTLALAVLAIVIAGAIGVSAGGSANISTGLYQVGVGEDVPTDYRLALENADSIQVYTVDSDKEASTLLDSGKYDAILLTTTGQPKLFHHSTDKSEAAVASVNDAIDNYNQMIMENEPNQQAAFPISVNVLNIPQDGSIEAPPGGTGDGSGTGENGDSTGGTDGQQNGEDGGQVSTGTTPGDISPPFPFESLILAFAFLIPMNFIVQMYGSSMIDERLKNRGELLLVSPISKFDIIFGKTLPYFAAIMSISAVVSFAIGSGFIGIVAILPLALLFLSCVFIATIFSRSYKELTFLTLGISVFVTSFAFIPAIFTEIHPISIISPLTLIVMELRGQEMALMDIAFSTLPLIFTSGLIYGLGAGIYREEDLFTQLPVSEKFLDSLAQQVSSVWSAGKLSGLALPFIFVAELLAVALLFIAPPLLSIFTVFILAAFIEEVGKSIHILAGFERDRYSLNIKTALIVGFLSGAGFFLAEKVVAIVQYVGLMDIQTGAVVFAGSMAPTGGSIYILILWPFIHSITAMISSVGAQYGRIHYAVALVLATIVHLAYNFGVLLSYGGVM